MLKLLKKLFSTGDGSYTVVVLNDDGSKPSSSYRLSPINLWLLCLGVLVSTVGLVIVLIFYTPLGSYVNYEQDIRSNVIAIQQRVAELQDTLDARNAQLQQIKQLMVTGSDTSFSYLTTIPERITIPPRNTEQSFPTSDNVQILPEQTTFSSSLFEGTFEFPAPYPLKGTKTRLFNRDTGHYGLDIAAQDGSSFSAIADGIIINQEWTINYGYVIVVQHAGGFLSVYKHAASTQNDIGESVQRGDTLGKIGDVGILSSGPHLHIEIWKNGIPQRPENYLINS